MIYKLKEEDYEKVRAILMLRDTIYVGSILTLVW